MHFSFNALPSVKPKSRASKRALYKQVSNELSLGRVYLWLFIIAFTLAITLGHWLNQQGLEGEPLGYSILGAAFFVWQMAYLFILNTCIASKVKALSL